MQPFGRNRYRPKIGAVPLWGRGAGSPSDTVWPGPRPTCTPRFILIRPTVWPQCTNVTYRTDMTERSDSIGRTVLQTVAQKQNLCYTGALESILRPRTKIFCNQKTYCYNLLTVYLSLVINCQTTLQLWTTTRTGSSHLFWFSVIFVIFLSFCLRATD